MSLLYHDAGLAEVVLTRITAEASKGPSEMTGMSDFSRRRMGR
ncbi:hypothetical protein [Arthrobacter sp. efr-133-TYG-120]|nr:hypothetical protein [Arthrobacter sp. efr-133-TYG-120]